MENRDEFEIFNANEPTTNVSKLETTNVDDELQNINISYVNDDSDIIEPDTNIDFNANLFDAPAAEDKYTFDENGTVIAANDEEAVIETEPEDKYTFDENGTVIAAKGEEAVVETEPEEKYTFDENGTVIAAKDEEAVIETEPEEIYTFDENGTVIAAKDEEAVVETEPEEKYTFDENGTVIAANDEEAIVETEPEDKYTFDENGTVIAAADTDAETNDDFTFDENGNVISQPTMEETVATTLEYTPESNEPKFTDEELEAIEDIKTNRDMINEEFKKLEEMINIAKETGIADSEYLQETFEKAEVFSAVNEKFNSDIDNYLSSANETNDEELELANIQL